MAEKLMRALVAREGVTRIEDRGIPAAGPGEVIVRTTAASMCSADPAGADGAFDVVSSDPTLDDAPRDGIVLGHEGVGVVHEIGAGVTGFSPGDRVMSVSTAPCGRCENCQRGFGGHCRGVMWGGYGSGLTRDGCLAEYYAVPDAQFNLAHVPDAVTDAQALFVADSFATGSSAVEGARLPYGGSVLVVGQGHIGLGAIAAARTAGAALVIAVKSRPGGEELAFAMGADIALNLTEDDVLARVRSLTGGQGVDLAIEASGATAGFELAVESTRLGGEISGIATYTTGGADHLSIPLESWGWGVGDKSIKTSYQVPGSERTSRLLRLLERGRIDVTPMFTHEYEFADALRALDDVRRGAPGLVKPIIRF